MSVSLVVDDKACIDALKHLSDDLRDHAVEIGLRQSAAVLELKIKGKLTENGRHEPGTPTPSAPGTPPAAISSELKGSVHAEDPKRSGFGNYSVVVGASMVYARVQEFGGGPSNLPARPYVQPAIEESSTQMREAFVRVIRRYANG